MKEGSLPRRYARALLELAQESGQVEIFEALLGKISAVFSQVPEALAALSDAAHSEEERMRGMEEIAKRFQMPPLLHNFFLLLVEKERIFLLPGIAREYQRLSDQLLNIMRAEVRSVAALPQGSLSRIEKILSQQTKKKVIAISKVEPELIGGMVLQLGETLYDGSLRTELHRLKDAMMQKNL